MQPHGASGPRVDYAAALCEALKVPKSSDLEKWFETVLCLLPVGVAIAEDPECRTTRCNPTLAEYLGLRVVKPGLARLPHPRSLPARLHVNGRRLEDHEFPLYRACREGEEVVIERCEILLNRGQSSTATIHARPIFSNGSVVGGVAVFTSRELIPDVDQPRHEAEASDRMQLLAAGITHHVNNMLVGVIGNASMALDMLEPDHPSRSFLQTSLQASDRITKIVHQVGIYAGNEWRRSEPVNVSNLIASSHNALLAAMPPKVTLHLSLAEVPLILGDPDQLREALQQVVMNGAEALGKKGGDIEIRTGVVDLTADDLSRMQAVSKNVGPGKYVYIRVEDSGRGIDPSSRRRIFDPFFTTKFFGRGLGLPLVWGVVRCHRGLIAVQSQASQGTAVTAYLPIAKAMDPLAESATPTP